MSTIISLTFDLFDLFEVNRDKNGETDEMNLEVYSKNAVMHI